MRCSVQMIRNVHAIGVGKAEEVEKVNSDPKAKAAL